MENFSFECSKIVKNALFLKKARVASHMNAKKVDSGGYLLFMVQSERAKCAIYVFGKY